MKAESENGRGGDSGRGASRPATIPGLSAIVTSFNEEENILDCLEALSLAQEILLVDSFSTDRTVEIAKSVPRVRIVQRPYFGAAAQVNWAMDQVSNPWILIVDADERVTPELAREITDLLAKGPKAEHYFLRRQNVFLDRVIRHSGWSTDRLVRLLKRGSARYPDRLVHSDMRPEGPTPVLSSPLLHYTSPSLDRYLVKLHRYAEWGAADLFRAGKRSAGGQVVLRPVWRFLRMYLFQAGFLDGFHGLVLCALQAYGVFLKWARVWAWGRLERNGLPVNLPAIENPPPGGVSGAPPSPP